MIIPFSIQEARSKRPPRMYESYFIARCEDFAIMQVTTPSTHNPQPFLKSEKESLYLPKEMSAVQIDYTTYYYTKETDLPGKFQFICSFMPLTHWTV